MVRSSSPKPSLAFRIYDRSRPEGLLWRKIRFSTSEFIQKHIDELPYSAQWMVFDCGLLVREAVRLEIDGPGRNLNG
jgi:hypothetical protein